MNVVDTSLTDNNINKDTTTTDNLNNNDLLSTTVKSNNIIIDTTTGNSNNNDKTTSSINNYIISSNDSSYSVKIESTTINNNIESTNFNTEIEDIASNSDKNTNIKYTNYNLIIESIFSSTDNNINNIESTTFNSINNYIESSIDINNNIESTTSNNIEEIASSAYINNYNKKSDIFVEDDNLTISVSNIFENKFSKENLKDEPLKDIPLIINNINTKDSDLEIQKINNDTILSCYSTKADLVTLISLNPNLTYINLKECADLLIKENNLDKNSDLLIVMEQNVNISNKDHLNFQVYTRDGKNISNLSVCDNIEIEVTTPIKDFYIIKYYDAEYLSKQGYDIYNKNSSFYYDYCLSAYINESDLSVNVRQQEIYPKNASLCPDDCNYNNTDYENKRINCICNNNITKEEDNGFEEELETNFFFNIIDFINYKIVLCYEKLFDKNNYISNFGFYIGIFLVFCFVILYLIYQCIGKKTIRKKYFLKEPNLKLIKEMELEYNKKKLVKNMKTKFQDMKACHHFQKNLKNPQIINIFNLNISNPEKKNKKKVKKFKKKSKITNDGRISSGNLNLYKSELFDNSKANAISKKISNINSKIGNKSENIEYNELSFNKALEIDKRNIFQIFLSQFVVKIKIIQIIFKPKEFTHLSLTLAFYLFDMLLDLTINSLLFSDDIIREKYINKGNILFITTNILSISSNIISFCLLYFLEKLINQYEILDIITREFKNKNNYFRIFIKISCCIGIKINCFFLILIIIGLFCTYYLFIFFAIYKTIQDDLFVNYIIGTLWSFGFTIFVCLLVAITRKISISKQIKRLFIISEYISDKF